MKDSMDLALGDRPALRARVMEPDMCGSWAQVVIIGLCDQIYAAESELSVVHLALEMARDEVVRLRAKGGAK